MTTPVGSGAVDNTPTTGGSLGYAASGYGGADRDADAPDVRQGRQHVPGEAPETVILDGPAEMTVGARRTEEQRPEQRRSEAPRAEKTAEKSS